MILVLALVVIVFVLIGRRIRDSRARWLGRPGMPADERNQHRT